MQKKERGKFTKYKVVGSFLVVRSKQKQRAVCLLGEKFLMRESMWSVTNLVKHVQIFSWIKAFAARCHVPVMSNPQTAELCSS